MNIAIFGLGYVGCVCAAAFSHNGHRVIGIDVSPGKVEAINAGRLPIIEFGLDDLVRTAVDSGYLRATSDGASAVKESDLSLICVGTPSNGNGSVKLQFVEHVCREIGAAIAQKQGYHVVVDRSTVLPGTVRATVIPIIEECSGLRAGDDFGVCMNPEFLREGSALEDFYHPGQIVIGEFDRRSGDIVAELYRGIDAPIHRTTLETAEMIKYVNNAFHAVKVVFANEIGNLCKALGTDGRQVMDVFCQDRRLNISPVYLKPGFGFGGSCLPKDLRALLHRGKQSDVECTMLSAVLVSNQKQVQRGIEMVESTGRKNVGVLGLSFKAGTDDVRESPTVTLVETLVGRGYHVCVYDERVQPSRLVGANKTFLERELPHIASLMRTSADEVVHESEVVVVGNASESWNALPHLLGPGQIVIDLVGIRDGIGKPQSLYEGICW